MSLDDFDNLGNWNKYKLCSLDLLKLSKSSNDNGLNAKAYRYLGNFYYNEKILDSSFYYYLKSEKKYLNIKDYDSYSVVLLKKGIVQMNINDFLGADISLRKAYNVLKETDDYQRIFATLNSLGSVSSELKEYSRAISYYKNALEVIEKGNIETAEHQEANCCNNLGLVYSDLKDYKKWENTEGVKIFWEFLTFPEHWNY